MIQSGHTPVTSYVVIFLAVAFFVYRNMRPQKLTAGRLWILPVFLIVVTGLSVWATSAVRLPGTSAPPLWTIVLAILVGLAAGIPLGLARGRASSVRLAEKRGAMIVEPSMVFALIWLAAFGLRFGLRLILPHADGAYFAISDGSIVFAASSIVALRYILYIKFRQLHLQSAEVVES